MSGTEPRKSLSDFSGPNEAAGVGEGSAGSREAHGRPSGSVLVMAPTFTEYAWSAEQAGAVVVSYPLDAARGFQPDFSTARGLKRLGEADLVFLCNPNNPTGVAVSNGEVLRLADRCRERGCLLVVDEAYVEFTERPEEITVVSEAPEREHVIVLRSLTKGFAVPGLRLGYVVAAPALVETLRAMQQPWPLNTFAVAVGTALVQQHEHLVRSRHLLRELRQEFQRALDGIPGLRPFPAAANFFLCRLETGAVTSGELAERLACRGIVIRNCDSFPGLEPGRFIRLAVRTRADNERLFQALREALTHAG